MARPGSNAPPVNGGEVRDTWLCRAGKMEVPGYHAGRVDDLLCRVAAELDAGGSAGQLIQNATFWRVKFGSRYDIEAVDWFLDRLLLLPGHLDLGAIADDPWGDLPVTQLARRASQRHAFELHCDSAWHDFGQVPGTQLRREAAPTGFTELRTTQQQTLASGRSSWREAVSAGGRSFTWQRTSASESSSPVVAELLARAARAEAGHFAENTRNRTTLYDLVIGSGQSVFALVDETGSDILYTAGDNFNRRACACILFPDLRWLRFLVRGTRRANAIMTAVDQAGNRVARYRITDKPGRQKEQSRSPVEIIVHPGQKLTNELALALALSADWLRSYFERPRGGR